MEAPERIWAGPWYGENEPDAIDWMDTNQWQVSLTPEPMMLEWVPAVRLSEVERERDRFRAEVRRLTEGWQIQHNRAERLAAAGNRLSIAAQTTGGTAGRAEGLCAAIDGWAVALQQEGGE